MNVVGQIDNLERPPASLWERIRAEPDRAPEYIALAAAERFAPAAEDWVRVAGPGNTPDKLARIAFTKHVRLARVEGAALGVGGAITAGPDLVALLWIQSRMVFYIAAAHGYDPRHPMRPAELLALVRFVGAEDALTWGRDVLSSHAFLLPPARGRQTVRS